MFEAKLIRNTITERYFFLRLLRDKSRSAWLYTAIRTTLHNQEMDTMKLIPNGVRLTILL